MGDLDTLVGLLQGQTELLETLVRLTTPPKGPPIIRRYSEALGNLGLTAVHVDVPEGNILFWRIWNFGTKDAFAYWFSDSDAAPTDALILNPSTPNSQQEYRTSPETISVIDVPAVAKTVATDAGVQFEFWMMQDTPAQRPSADLPNALDPGHVIEPGD